MSGQGWLAGRQELGLGQTLTFPGLRRAAARGRDPLKTSQMRQPKRHMSADLRQGSDQSCSRPCHLLAQASYLPWAPDPHCMADAELCPSADPPIRKGEP